MSKEENPENNRPYSNDDITKIILTAISKLIHANRAKEKADKKRTECREKWHFRLIFVEISLVAVYATVTIFEWKTFDSERKTMEEEFKAAQTNAMDQLAEIRKDRTLDERAWVTANGVKFDPGSNVSYKNTGKTPAINLQDVAHWTYDLSSIPKEDARPKDLEYAGLFAPDCIGWIQPNSFQNNVTTDPAARGFYIYGTIWYDDIFGFHHWSQFSYKLTNDGIGNMQVAGVPIHNACDDSEANEKNRN